jgi:hypothetical protein
VSPVEARWNAAGSVTSVQTERYHFHRREAVLIYLSGRELSGSTALYGLHGRGDVDVDVLPADTFYALSSETSRPGDPVRLAVARRVIVDGNVAIEQGTIVSGSVVDAHAGATLWQTARLSITVNETRAVGGEVVRFRSAPIRPLRGRAAYILWHSQGVTFDALVDGDQMIAGEAAPIQERPIRAVEIPLTTPADVLTNEDIVKLIRAGFAEDW